MPVSAPADKRFRRAHVRPTRQKPRSVRWLKLAAVAIVVVTLAFGAFGVVGYALSSKRLRIRHIAVSGNTRMSSHEVSTLLSDLIGASVLTVDLDASRLKLLASPWVAEAEIRRVFPGSIAVAVAERRAVAVGRLGTALFLLDQHGMVIGPFGPAYAQFDFPIVDGLVTGSEQAPVADDARAALTMRVLSALQAHSGLASRVSQIDVSDLHDVALVLRDDTVMVRVGTEKFAERLQAYVELAPALRDRVPDIDYVDLRYGERVYLRPHRPDHTAHERGVKE